VQLARGLYEIENEFLLPYMEAIEYSYGALVQLPPSVDVRFAEPSFRREIAEQGDRAAEYSLLADLYNWFKFFVFTTGYKTRQLTEGLFFAYNASNYLTWVTLARSVVEHAAVFCYFASKTDELELSGPHLKASHLKRLDELLTAYAQGTRFNWDALMNGDVDSIEASYDKSAGRPRAVNVLTALRQLGKRDHRFEDVEVAYSLLSDLVHPNMGSHVAVVDRRPMAGRVHHWELTSSPGTSRGEFIIYLTLPTVARALGKILETTADLSHVIEAWMDLLDKPEQLAIDFRM